MGYAVRRVKDWLAELLVDEFVSLQPPTDSWRVWRLMLAGVAG
jgi:hypothetical protein